MMEVPFQPHIISHYSLTIPNIQELRVNATSNIDYDKQNMAYSILSFLKVVLISE